MSSRSARENLLQQLRQASREYTLALEARRRLRRELRKVDHRVRDARRRLRLVEQAIPAATDAPLCGTCRAPLGATPACVECSAARTLVEP